MGDDTRSGYGCAWAIATAGRSSTKRNKLFQRIEFWAEKRTKRERRKREDGGGVVYVLAVVASMYVKKKKDFWGNEY
jgi:hypothetical protein